MMMSVMTTLSGSLMVDLRLRDEDFLRLAMGNPWERVRKRELSCEVLRVESLEWSFG